MHFRQMTTAAQEKYQSQFSTRILTRITIPYM